MGDYEREMARLQEMWEEGKQMMRTCVLLASSLRHDDLVDDTEKNKRRYDSEVEQIQLASYAMIINMVAVPGDGQLLCL